MNSDFGLATPLEETDNKSMSEQDNPAVSHFSLKQQLLTALQSSLESSRAEDDGLPGEIRELEQPEQAERAGEENENIDFSDTLSGRGVVPEVNAEAQHPTAGAPCSFSPQAKVVKSDSMISGGSMADLSGYKDLSKAPFSLGEEETTVSTLNVDNTTYERSLHQTFAPTQHFVQESVPPDVDTEFSGNVKTLIRLVNELPDGVTKQTGAQIIRLTMEAMGISMEDVLSEAQSAQSEMLDAVRANIKKIEEYKTVIRKLETDIKYYQGKANELSEIIDLFILSNTSGNKVPMMPDDLSH